MKRILLTSIIVLSCMCSYAQQADSLVYTRENLANMGKVSLSRIYVQHVNSILIEMNSLPLGNTSGNVPDNRYVRKLWKRINHSSYVVSSTLRENCDDLFPYSDKSKLVDSILYLQSVLLEMGKMSR